MTATKDDSISYVVPRFGTAAEPIAKALQFAKTLTQGSPSPRDLVILCHEKRYFARSTAVTALPESLRRGRLRTFLAGDRVPLGSSATLRLESLNTIRKSAAPEIALVCNADTRLLSSLLHFDKVGVVVAIAFTLSRIEEWILKEGATIPGTPTCADGALRDDDVAVEALWALTYMVDPRDAWVRPWQREAAIEILWSLYTRGCRPKPADVKRWARQNGWSPDSAEQLKRLANEVAQNRVYPKELGVYWWPDTFKVLKSLAGLRKQPSH